MVIPDNFKVTDMQIKQCYRRTWLPCQNESQAQRYTQANQVVCQIVGETLLADYIFSYINNI